MAYESTGLQALFPIYLSRMANESEREAYDIAAAQNEANLNQNLEILSRKLMELEAFLTTLE